MATKLVLLGLLINLLIVKDAQSVGVCYGRNGDGLPSERDVVSLYQRNNINKMRIYDPNPSTLEALRGTNIEVMIGVPNDVLQSLNDQNATNTWVSNNILRYSNNVRFRYIVVGNEVDPNNENSQYAPFVLRAMQNVYNSIRNAGLANQIKVSTATYSGLLGTSYPPSSGAFRDDVLEYLEPIMRFLAQNNQLIVADLYTTLSNAGLNLPYALFTASRPMVNDNGRQYYNLFDAILDAHYAAQARLGGGNLEIVVSESGWPSSGGSFATTGNAGTYYRNLISHVKGTSGTPMKPGRSIETFLFAMFDENKRPGSEEERHFGLFFPNQQPKYGQLSFN